MSITAAILLVISALTHAGWNFISKKEHPSQAFYLVSNTIGVICVTPNLCCFLAMLSAVSVAGYTTVDDEALRQLRQLAETPFNPIEGTLVYMVLEGISCSLWQCVSVFFNPSERKNITDKLNTLKGPAAITGIGIYLTYGFALASMNYVTNINYVAAFRQLSIPLGAIFGLSLLKEPCHPSKMLGISIISIGLVVVAIG